MYQFLKECRLAIHCLAEPTNKKSQKFKNVYQNKQKYDLGENNIIVLLTL